MRQFTRPKGAIHDGSPSIHPFPRPPHAAPRANIIERGALTSFDRLRSTSLLRQQHITARSALLAAGNFTLHPAQHITRFQAFALRRRCRVATDEVYLWYPSRRAPRDISSRLRHIECEAHIELRDPTRAQYIDERTYVARGATRYISLRSIRYTLVNSRSIYARKLAFDMFAPRTKGFLSRRA